MIPLLISLSKVPPKVIKSTYLKPVLILIFNKFLPKENFTQNQKQVWNFILQEDKKKGFVLNNLKRRKLSIIKNQELNKRIVFFCPLGKNFLKLIF